VGPARGTGARQGGQEESQRQREKVSTVDDLPLDMLRQFTYSSSLELLAASNQELGRLAAYLLT